jgi:hypothetical protein
MTGFCEHSYGYSDFIRSGTFLISAVTINFSERPCTIELVNHIWIALGMNSSDAGDLW